MGSCFALSAELSGDRKSAVTFKIPPGGYYLTGTWWHLNCCCESDCLINPHIRAFPALDFYSHHRLNTSALGRSGRYYNLSVFNSIVGSRWRLNPFFDPHAQVAKG